MESVFNNSDHHYIRFSLSESTPNQSQPAARDPHGWNTHLVGFTLKPSAPNC